MNNIEELCQMSTALVIQDQETNEDQEINEDQETNEEINQETEEQIKIKKDEYNSNMKDLKDIILRINKLKKKEKMHILNILKINYVTFTKNENGYFFNCLTINNNIISKITKCVESIEKNGDLIKELDKKRDELITYYKILIEERLQNTLRNRKLNYMETIIVKKFSNINYNINRIYKIKRKVVVYEIDDNSMQPDVLVKYYLKNIFKFKKDSVHSRIYTCIKSMQNRKSKSCILDTNDNVTEGDGLEISLKEFDEGEYDLDEVNDDLDNIDEEAVEEIEGGEEVEEIDEIEGIEELDIDEIEEEIDSKKNIKKKEDFENDNETDDIDEDLEIKDDIEDDDINYYKNLLHLRGFIFDENKQCALIYQEYIS